MSFDVKKHLIRVQGGREYLPVKARLVWFREEHPDWGIKTNCTQFDAEKGMAMFHASITDTEGRTLSEGTKMETARDFGDYAEKAETGAVGRALGMLGYGTEFAPELDEGERIVDSPKGIGFTHPPQPTASGQPQPQGATTAVCARCEEAGTLITLSPAVESSSRKAYGVPLCTKHMAEAHAGQKDTRLN